MANPFRSTPPSEIGARRANRTTGSLRTRCDGPSHGRAGRFPRTDRLTGWQNNANSRVYRHAILRRPIRQKWTPKQRLPMFRPITGSGVPGLGYDDGGAASRLSIHFRPCSIKNYFGGPDNCKTSQCPTIHSVPFRDRPFSIAAPFFSNHHVYSVFFFNVVRWIPNVRAAAAN